MTDPSVLDFLSAKLRFWRNPPPGMPSLRELWFEETSEWVQETEAEPEPDREPDHAPSLRTTAPPGEKPAARQRWTQVLQPDEERGPAPLAMVSAGLLAMVGLTVLQQVNGIAVAVILLAGAAGAAYYAVVRGEVPTTPDGIDEFGKEAKIRLLPAAGAALACAATAVAAADNRAGPYLAVVWLIALVLAVVSVTGLPAPGRIFRRAVPEGEDPTASTFALSKTLILPLLIFAAAIGLRTWHLASVPAEMLSVHAELIQATVVAGRPEPPVVFPWGFGGIEPVAVYLGLILASLAGGIGFASLKLGTLLAGLATLPVVYLLGREIGGRAAGLGGMALVAAASWPDLVSRIGLAEGWYPPLAAASLLMLLRGARRGRRRDFVAAGVITGLAIQTDSMARSLVVAATVLLAAAWIASPRERRRRLASGLVVVLIFTVVAGLPTLAAARPTADAVDPSWWLGAAEGSRDHDALSGFVERFGRVLIMPIWSDGPAWDHGGGSRPALDRVAATLLVLGTALLAMRSIFRRRLGDGLMLLAVPLAVLPAALASVEPALAPSPLRCAGAMGPIFAVAGFGLVAAVRAMAGCLPLRLGRPAAAIVSVLLVVLTALAGHTVVHSSFAETWDAGAWNASELGEVVRGAVALGVPLDRARVVPHPHWVDTRLVAAEAGLPGGDLAIDPATVASTARRPGAQLYLVHRDDHRTLRVLREALPAADVVQHPSRVPGKSFMAVTNIAQGNN